MSSTDEKKGLNEGVFRKANEKIESYAEELGESEDVPVPFLCECTSLECKQVLRMTLPEYEAVRAQGKRGFVVPGHEDLAVERVVARQPKYFVVEKFGRAGEVAETTDPRA